MPTTAPAADSERWVQSDLSLQREAHVVAGEPLRSMKPKPPLIDLNEVKVD